MRVTTAVTTSAICLVLAAAVLISGARAKDLAAMSLPALWLDAKKQTDDAGAHIVKLVSDLHDHTDKSLKVQPGDNQMADSRSLRLFGEHKKTLAQRNKVAERLRLWWELKTLHLG